MSNFAKNVDAAEALAQVDAPPALRSSIQSILDSPDDMEAKNA